MNRIVSAKVALLAGSLLLSSVLAASCRIDTEGSSSGTMMAKAASRAAAASPHFEF